MPNEERTAVDLRALLSGLVLRLRDDARHPKVTFELRDEGEPSLPVHGVSHRLEALFRELLENAASFAGEKGQVTVALMREEGKAVVVVSDSGPGIGAEDLPRVFTRFFTTRGHQRGTGLGLALVRAVAEAHGGDVHVSSEDGKGATFRVRLPSP